MLISLFVFQFDSSVLAEVFSSDEEVLEEEHRDVEPFTNALEQGRDDLPQPFRMIDNVLQYIINRAGKWSRSR